MTVRKAITVSLIVLALGTALGAMAGTGFAIFGDIKGGWEFAVVIGVIAGASLGLPVVAFSLIDLFVTASWKKIIVVVPVLFGLSFCVPVLGGPVMFLQFCAIVVPALIVRTPWKTLLLGLAGGFVFLVAWYLLYFHGLALIRSSDDIFVFYPFAIAVVSIDAAIARAISRRYGRRQLTGVPSRPT